MNPTPVERPEINLPSKMHVDTTMQFIPGPEMKQLMQDLHAAGPCIVLAGFVLLGCVVALTFKKVFGSPPAK